MTGLCGTACMNGMPMGVSGPSGSAWRTSSASFSMLNGARRADIGACPAGNALGRSLAVGRRDLTSRASAEEAEHIGADDIGANPHTQPAQNAVIVSAAESRLDDAVLRGELFQDRDMAATRHDPLDDQLSIAAHAVRVGQHLDAVGCRIIAGRHHADAFA